MPANTPRGISYPLYSDPISGTQTYFQDMATDMDGLVQQLEDRLEAARQRPAAKIVSFTNQSLTPFVDNIATFEAEEFDRGGMADIATNNTRIRLLERGIYLVGASLSVAPANGTWGLRAELIATAGLGGGFASLRGSSLDLDASSTPTYINPVALWFADGVTTADVTCRVRHDSPSALTLQSRNFFAAKVSNTLGGF